MPFPKTGTITRDFAQNNLLQDTFDESPETLCGKGFAILI
jgi:hypothetical protein